MKYHTSFELEGHRIRIEGPKDNLKGYACKVTDLDTGEEIGNITRIEIFLDAQERNTAQLTLLLEDTHGLSGRHHHQKEHVTVSNPEIAVSAIVKKTSPEHMGGNVTEIAGVHTFQQAEGKTA